MNQRDVIEEALISNANRVSIFEALGTIAGDALSCLESNPEQARRRLLEVMDIAEKAKLLYGRNAQDSLDLLMLDEEMDRGMR